MSSSSREQVNELEQGYWAYVKRQFKKNKRALFSLYAILFLAFVALTADFIANEKPIYAQYNGTTYFPILKSYGVALGVSSWPKELQNVTWKNLEYDSVIFPPIPYSPSNQDFKNAQYKAPNGEQRVKSKRWWHWLGTDGLGRDVFAGMIHATRIALAVGLVAMSIAGLIGIILGTIAGYFGDQGLRMSRIRFFLNIIAFFIAIFYAFSARMYVLGDAIGESIISFVLQGLISVLIFAAVMIVANLIAQVLKKIPFLGTRMNVPLDLGISRLIEVVVAVPRIFLIISIVAVAKPSLILVMVVLGLTGWTGIARLIRAELLRVRSLEYMEAAKALGFGDFRIMLKHAIPNALSPVLISLAFGIAAAILTEAFLSFIGLGVPAETVTWGSLLNLARANPGAWWLATFPGIAIFLTVTFLNLIGEGLTDALDPRLKK